jgi:sugar lactone lactonase YvrE
MSVAAGLCAAIGAQGAQNEPETTWAEILPESAQIERLVGGFRFIEGPVWMPGGTLVFSDIPADTMYEWSGGDAAAVFRTPSNNSNGNTLDRRGRLITCHHGSRSVPRTEPDGTVTVIAEKFEGRRLNSPNDAVVRSNGDIYFTDPPEVAANCAWGGPDRRTLYVTASTILYRIGLGIPGVVCAG